MKGFNVGYIRVSTADQNIARQKETFKDLKLDKVFIDHASGKDMYRPELEKCFTFLRGGDHLYVPSIDRLARNLRDLLSMLQELAERGVPISFHAEGLTFTGEDSPFQKLQLQIIGSVAEFERSLIKERQREGIALARAAGKYRGRTPALSPEQAGEIRQRCAGGESKAALAQEFRISRQSIYNILKNPR